MSESPTDRTITRLRNAFVATFIVGIAGVVLGWLLEPSVGSGPSLVLTVGVPVVAMVGYFLVGNGIERSNKATDLFADSIYYLGFLFTLVALVTSLFSVPGEGSTSGLIYRFGAALCTTLLGLFGRTYLASFRPSARDELSRLEYEIESAAVNLRDRFTSMSETMTLQGLAHETSLNKLIADLEQVSQSMNQVTSDIQDSGRAGVNKLIALVNEAAEQLSSVSTNAAARASRAIEEATDAIGAASYGLSEQSNISMGKFRDSFEHASRDLVDASASIVERAQSIDLPSDLFTSRLGPSLDQLENRIRVLQEKISSQVQSATGVEKDVRRVAAGLSAVLQNMSTLAETAASRERGAAADFEHLSGHIATITARVSEYSDAISKHLDQFERLNEASKGYSAQVASDARASAERRKELERELTRSTLALSVMREELVNAANFVRAELETT